VHLDGAVGNTQGRPPGSRVAQTTSEPVRQQQADHGYGPIDSPGGVQQQGNVASRPLGLPGDQHTPPMQRGYPGAVNPREGVNPSAPPGDQHTHSMQHGHPGAANLSEGVPPSGLTASGAIQANALESDEAWIARVREENRVRMLADARLHYEECLARGIRYPDMTPYQLVWGPSYHITQPSEPVPQAPSTIVHHSMPRKRDAWREEIEPKFDATSQANLGGFMYAFNKIAERGDYDEDLDYVMLAENNFTTDRSYSRVTSIQLHPPAP
jgi:hypothetical protein